MSVDLLVSDTLSSATRWLLGLSIGAASAFAVGTALSITSALLSFGKSAADFLRAVPILAIVPLVQFYLGPEEFSKLFIIAFACFFPILISMMLSLRTGGVERERFFAGLGLRKIRRWRLEKFPQLIDGFKRGLVIAVGVAWICVVAAESIGAYSDAFLLGGLGYRLSEFLEIGDIGAIWLYVLVFGALGAVSATLLHFVLRVREDREL